MSENGVKGARRSRRQLSPETKWEVFLQVTSGALSQADAARKWQVDVSTIIGIRRTAKDAALAAFARKPGRPRPSGMGAGSGADGDRPLTSAITAQAIELAVVRGKSGWG